MPLIYFWIVEDHHPERVFRQFGMKQVPPDIMDTFVHLHKICLQGKLDKDWVQKHAVYIDRWAYREEHIADAPALDGYITRDSAYWEILVRQQFDASFMD